MGSAIVGRRVVEVESAGKHVLVHFEGGLSLRTHLGMPGSWHIYRPGERFRRSPGAARVVIRTDEWVGVCFSAPTVQAGPTGDVLAAVDHLGPDLLAAEFHAEEAVRRARASPAGTVADLLLDQRVMAGVGNVFKSEALFLERLHPQTAPSRLDGEHLLALVNRARRLLLANREGGPRVTTGRYRPGGDLWVYGRTGRPCRRGGELIEDAWLGDPPRVTYWCPGCQVLGR